MVHLSQSMSDDIHQGTPTKYVLQEGDYPRTKCCRVDLLEDEKSEVGCDFTSASDPTLLVLI